MVSKSSTVYRAVEACEGEAGTGGVAEGPSSHTSSHTAAHASTHAAPYQSPEQRYRQDCIAAAMEIAAAAYDITRDQILAPRRCRAHIAEGRQVAMYLAHIIGEVTPTEAAPHFRRDRTTIAHACARIEDRRDDAYFDNGLAHLEERMLERVGRLKLRRLAEENPPDEDGVAGAPLRLVRMASGKFYRFEKLPEDG